MKRELPRITLLGVDCVDLHRIQFAANVCEKEIVFGAIKILSSIPSNDPRIIAIPPIRSTKEYSEFCVKEMAYFVDTDFVLVFQYDGFILNPSAWMDEFLEYDYIGAPWYHEGPLRVGNGGFSLRSKRLLDFIAANYKRIGGPLHPEDFWISKRARPFLEKAGMQFAPEEIASRFSKEGTIRSVVWNGEFGFHGATYTDISKWLDLHPEYKEGFLYKLDDFANLFRKYPIYDGTVHVFRSRKIHMNHYRRLAAQAQTYDVRMDKDFSKTEWTEAKVGHMVVYKRSGVPFSKVPIPAFEREIVKIDHFPTKSALLKKYPKTRITPSLALPRWKQKLFGNLAFPEHESYTVLWYESLAKNVVD